MSLQEKVDCQKFLEECKTYNSSVQLTEGYLGKSNTYISCNIDILALDVCSTHRGICTSKDGRYHAGYRERTVVNHSVVGPVCKDTN